MENNTQARKWLMVINNPLDSGFSHEVIRELLHTFNPSYFCMADEIATTGTYHTHIYLYAASPIRFGTIKRRFPVAHIEKAYGTAYENRTYIKKEGKWEDTAKKDTATVDNTFEEWGKVPHKNEERNPHMHKLIECVKNGMKNNEIIEEMPEFAFKIRDIDILRQTLLSEKYSRENRKVEVTYLYGISGSGKTWGIFQKYDAQEICRITHYRKNQGVYFDLYHGQDILVFEEFYSQVPIEEMLNYLDIYPLSLPARYSDRVACYTKVYITSNSPLEEQYLDVQASRPETWRAFLRRIDHVIEYLPDGTTVEKKGEN